MRLDLFLKISRIAKTRTEAQRLCSAGAVGLNGTAAKASRPVVAGDIIQIDAGDGLKSFEILIVPGSKQVSKVESRELTRQISPQEPGQTPMG
jgi:ribosomal 50S subunit-recycling heat shock protein